MPRRLAIILTVAAAVLGIVQWSRHRSATRPHVAPAAPAPADPSIRGLAAAPPVAQPPRPALAATAPAPVPPPAPRGLKRVLSDKLAELDLAIEQCLAGSRAAGLRPTGAAILRYIAGRDPATGLGVVEDTGISDETDKLADKLADEPLLACLQGTARALSPIELADGTDSLHVDWRIELLDGALTHHRVIEYSNRRDTDDPLD